MLSVMKRIVTRVGRKQSGFTLVELLVVVGIIVALAAVVIPNVIQFADQGDEGATFAEAATVQTAVDTYMADNSFVTIAANDLVTDTSDNDFSAAGIIDLTGYLRNVTTINFYCWEASGLVSFQDGAATLDCT